MLKKLLFALSAVALFAIFSTQAQIKDRNINEIKEEALFRAENGGAYPLIGLDLQDVKEALGQIKTRNPDEWAQAWGVVADKYMQQAKKASSPDQASALYKKAWRLYFFGQWPAPTSKGKMESYNKALDAYLQYSKNMDPPLQVIKVPFEGKELVAYLRLPKDASANKPVPMIYAVSGLDSRKETVADSYAQILKHGIGIFVIDSPGTGQAPIKVSPTAERMLSAGLDYLVKRPEVDSKRIIFSGVSFGAYWATKMAIIEKDRLLGSVAQSPPVHDTFQSKFVEKKLSTPEYLFDYLPATINVYEGVSNLDQLLAYVPKMSIKEQNLLNRPTSPMLILAGVNDTQVLLSDIKMLMEAGDVPKDFWINPKGGHLGREVKGWTDANIFSKVIIPWELRLLEESGWKK